MKSEKVKGIKNWLENESEVYRNEIAYNTLDLINELESENERLTKENYQLEQNLGQCENGYRLELHTARYQLHSANEDLKKAEKRIAELEKKNERLKNRITCKIVMPNDKLEEIKNECFKKVELAKDKLLNQFAERLKEKITTDYINGTREYAIAKIDETLKEFQGK